MLKSGIKIGTTIASSLSVYSGAAASCTPSVGTLLFGPGTCTGPTTFPNGTENTAYCDLNGGADIDALFTGDCVYSTYELASGTLPTGMNFTSGGKLQGTPTETGTFNISFTANYPGGSITSNVAGLFISPGG